MILFELRVKFYVCLTVKIAVDASSKLKFASFASTTPHAHMLVFVQIEKGVTKVIREHV